VVFLYNLLDLKRTIWEGPELEPGKHTIVFDFKSDGPGLGKGGTGVLSVDGKEVARNSMDHTTPVTFPEDETFDVGQDTKSGGPGQQAIPKPIRAMPATRVLLAWRRQRVPRPTTIARRTKGTISNANPVAASATAAKIKALCFSPFHLVFRADDPVGNRLLGFLESSSAHEA
jgi:hypothetical protein